MTIGELLKEYRIAQGKNQKEFINDGMIVSQSYYSKVEKNAHKIAADSLLDLLHYNNIPVWEFFSRLNSSDKMKHQQIEEFNRTMHEAYYEKNIEKVRNLRPIVKESNLSEKDKEEELLLIDAWLEVMKEPSQKPDLELRTKIKEKIFNIPNFNDNKVALFCNFMPFYDLESNIVIAKKIINQYINTKNTKMQIAVLAIIVNILAFSLRDNKEMNTDYFIENGDKVKIKPELVFYKSAFCFFKNIILYHRTNNKEYYDESVKIKDFLIYIGISKYGKVLENLLVTYR
ncbi:helix-turn-helix domain-containing protein [uncultured Lactobacillus sp.]|uniref:helix-turn-helix domain-containing protein n=1 Tax=uncultured Lactobacillus sp. TaxID=153152 RepID=UPI00263625CF|nr:Rgg/GadR/MutR family transcriptional regulator [uncultured Lactobacillus sp.]